MQTADSLSRIKFMLLRTDLSFFLTGGDFRT